MVTSLHMSFLGALQTLLLIMALTSPAQAAMNAEDAKHLKTVFSTMLERYSNEAKLQGGELVAEGDLLVEPSDNYYAVTLPHLSIIGADKSKINIGMIAINAVPGDKKSEWKMTIAIPTPITLYGTEGHETGVIQIGSQSFAGVLHETFGNFVRLNARYKDISFTDPVEDARVNMGDMTIIYDLKETSDGLWSGPMNLVISNIQALFNRTGAAGKISSIKIDSTVKDYSVVEAHAYTEKMNALMESLGSDTPSVSGQHVQGMFNTVADFLTTVWDGFGSQFSISGMEFINPASAGKPATTLQVQHLGFGMTGGGLKGNRATLQHTINMTGLSVTPDTSGMKEMVPENVNFDMTITNLPLKDLLQMARENLGHNMATPEGGNLVALNALAQTQQLLTQAATSLEIKDTGLGKNAAYDLKLNGAALANIQAVMGATGKMRLEIMGVENLISLTQKAINDPSIQPADKEKAQKALQSMTFLQMIGQQSKNAAGQDIRAYDFELTTDGKTLLNGADMMSVMGAGKPTP